MGQQCTGMWTRPPPTRMIEASMPGAPSLRVMDANTFESELATMLRGRAMQKQLDALCKSKQQACHAKKHGRNGTLNMEAEIVWDEHDFSRIDVAKLGTDVFYVDRLFEGTELAKYKNRHVEFSLGATCHIVVMRIECWCDCPPECVLVEEE